MIKARAGIRGLLLRGFSETTERAKSKIVVNWKRKDGTIKSTSCTEGVNLMQLAHQFDIELEGACAGVCACSTCHVILPQSVYDGLPEASEDEEDMLDQAFGLTSTSRLGCQVILEKKHEGIIVELPRATRNMYVDGHVPKPH
jgi:ferredoxin